MNIPKDIDDAAKECAGNHRKFDSFGWFSRPEDDENWMIYNISHRDSGILDESNEHVILKELAPFMEGDDPDVYQERHSHWAVGHVNALIIRVYKGEEITKAFKTLHELMVAIEGYPVLDDSDYSQREYDAQIEAIENEAPWAGDHERPEDWANQVWSYLWDNDQSSSLFERDEPYIDKEDIAKAMDEIGIAYDKDN